jgi:hypothetical protein
VENDNNFKTLFYDIETGLLSAEIFRLGEQVIRHNQLIKSCLYTPILTIAYAINDGPIKVITADPDYTQSKPAIEKFDAIVSSCDVVVGKNNIRFDNKHINTHRMLSGMPGMPEWLTKSDDLERQFRRYFNLPSQSLDAISDILGLGGKDKMEFSDWQAIKHMNDVIVVGRKYGKEAQKAVADHFYKSTLSDIMSKGKIAIKKMEVYNAKDVEDTRAIWNYAKSHFTPKFNRSMQSEQCKECGSGHTIKNGKTVDRSGSTWQNFFCNDHNGFAGKGKLLKNGQYSRLS